METEIENVDVQENKATTQMYLNVDFNNAATGKDEEGTPLNSFLTN